VPGTIDCEEFATRYGYAPEEYLVRVIKGLLHPDPRRWDVHFENGATEEAEAGLRGDETRRKAAAEYVAGTRKFENLLPYMGSISGSIVRSCSPDLDLVHASVQ
jgi:hypothetical protein